MKKYILGILALCTIATFQNCQHADFNDPTSAQASASSSPNAEYAWKLEPTNITSVMCLDPNVVSHENPTDGEPCDPYNGPGLHNGTSPERFINEVTEATPAAPYPGALSSECYSAGIRAFSCELKTLPASN